MARFTHRLGALTSAAVLLGLVALVGAFAVEASHGLELDHFKCYISRDLTSANEPVMLRDQFGPAQARVLTVLRFCNPVEKTTQDGTVTPIKDPNAHLAIYRISPQPLVPRTVIVSNQFGDAQRLEVAQAAALAVPTKKDDHDFPRNLDHFLCYRARGQRIDEPVRLRDQFLLDRARVLDPIALCNPVEKTHDGVVTPIQHPDEHLVCYTIRTQTPVARAVRADNQFGLETLNLGSADILCVPSKKQLVP